MKAVARDLPVVMLPLILYTDDTSGNKSKQWNKFDSWCLKLASLPNKENQNIHNIHLICTSNKVWMKPTRLYLLDSILSIAIIGGLH